MAGGQMADDMDAQILNAAVTIRRELVHLIPAEADTLGGVLDEHIAKAQAASAEDRPEFTDEIFEVLSRRAPTRRRLNELCLFADADRGADFSVFNQTLAGEVKEGKKLRSYICQTCNYPNMLAFRPPEDDPPECQNPDFEPHHPLKLS
jgi:hypothetical protein